MEPQNLWLLLLSTGLVTCGWVLRTMYDAIRELERGLAEHKIAVANTYATNHDLARIEDKLDRILERVERKADR